MWRWRAGAAGHKVGGRGVEIGVDIPARGFRCRIFPTLIDRIVGVGAEDPTHYGRQNCAHQFVIDMYLCLQWIPADDASWERRR